MAGNGDMKTHEATYASLIGLMKWGTIGCAAVAALVIYLIA